MSTKAKAMKRSVQPPAAMKRPVLAVPIVPMRRPAAVKDKVKKARMRMRMRMSMRRKAKNAKPKVMKKKSMKKKKSTTVASGYKTR